MGRLIDADALHIQIELAPYYVCESGRKKQYGTKMNKTVRFNPGDTLLLYEDVSNFILDAPTIGAEHVRHGRWIETNKPGWVNGQFYETPRLVCPFCTREAAHYSVEHAEHGGSVTELYWIRTDCCPHCGAKMDLKEENA